MTVIFISGGTAPGAADDASNLLVFKELLQTEVSDIWEDNYGKTWTLRTTGNEPLPCADDFMKHAADKPERTGWLARRIIGTRQSSQKPRQLDHRRNSER